MSEAVRVTADVVLMDLHMPGMGGVDATRRLQEEAPHVGVVVLSLDDEDASVVAALRSGARAYAVKGARHGELARAIRSVAHGEAHFDTQLAARLTDLFARTDPRRPPRLSRAHHAGARGFSTSWPEGFRTRRSPRASWSRRNACATSCRWFSRRSARRTAQKLRPRA